MDPNISAVVVALITGLFSIIAIYVQRKQEKVIDKIDKHALFIEREKAIKQKLDATEKEVTGLIHDMIILTLKTNMSILKNTQVASVIDEDVFKAAEDLEAKFNAVQDSLEKLRSDYALVLDMTSEFQREIDKAQHDGK